MAMQAATSHAEAPSTPSTQDSDDSQERNIVQQVAQEHISPDTSDNNSDVDLFQVSQEEEHQLIPLLNAIGIACENQPQSNGEHSPAAPEGYFLRGKCKLAWNPKMNNEPTVIRKEHR